jgi:L-lysine 2,3-aminomutase
VRLPVSGLPVPTRFQVYGPKNVDQIADRYGLPADLTRSVRALSQVYPFRVNEYVLSHLIDWRSVPSDPLFQLVFPQPGMLEWEQERQIGDLLDSGDRRKLAAAVLSIRSRLNPHPSGQMQFNVPTLDGVSLSGMQHKYRETVLYFPKQGQTCHSFCTYCFRWAQFVDDVGPRFVADGPAQLVAYLSRHPAVSDVLITGGDPLIMGTRRLREHMEPVLAVETVHTIRIGTKSLAYWPQRFVTDSDADDLLRLFEQVIATGRTLAVMAHVSHPRELDTNLVRRALTRIRGTGAVIYCQAPLIRYVNNDAKLWVDMWSAEFAAGAVPYYMFVERDTGPHEYFKVPLVKAVEIFQTAYRQLPGLARTVRGPVMSASAGKIVVDGIETLPDGRRLALRLLQARDPELVGRPFRALFSDTASWIDELVLDAHTPAEIAAAIGLTPGGQETWRDPADRPRARRPNHPSSRSIQNEQSASDD